MLAQLRSPNTLGGAVSVRKTETPERYGIAFSRDDDLLWEVVEKPTHLSGIQRRIVASYFFRSDFVPILSRYRGQQADGFEAALSDYAKLYPVLIIPAEPDAQEITLKYPWDLFSLHGALVKQELSEGNLVIHPDASVHPTAILEPPVFVGQGAKIMGLATVKNHCVIGPGAVVGSYSLVRDFSLLGEGVMVGAHSEVTRSLLYAGSSLHRNFVGDSILDRGVHFGAGTVTANRRHDRKIIKSTAKEGRISTGKTSLGAIVGEEARLGINCSLRPGVKIGSRAVIYEGVAVISDVENRTHWREDGTKCRP